MKKILILFLFSILLVACGKDEGQQRLEEAKKRLSEAEKSLEETKKVKERVEETTELIEDYKEKVEETYASDEIEEVELTEREEMMSEVIGLIDEGHAFDTGSYIKGEIPKGEYAFITFNGDSEYYVEKDDSGNIIDNENFDSFGYVQVHEAGNIEVGGFLINEEGLKELDVTGAKELYEVINEKENFVDAGYYKVGIDIEPGEYVVESYGEGYVAVMSGPVGNSEIIDNNNFNGKYSVNLKDGEYLNISRAIITD